MSVDSYYTHPAIRAGGIHLANTHHFKLAGCEMLMLSRCIDDGHTNMIPCTIGQILSTHTVATRSNLKTSECFVGMRSPPQCAGAEIE